MIHERNFTITKGGIASVVSFGAIDYLQGLLSSANLAHPLLLLDSHILHLLQKGLPFTPALIDFNEQSEKVENEIETLLSKKKVDSLIIICNQNGIDYAKIALYNFTKKIKHPHIPLIVIPTSYTAVNSASDEVFFYNRDSHTITHYSDPLLQPHMIIIDERVVSNSSAKEKALSVVAIIGGLIDALHHTPYASSEYFMALEGLSLCKEYGYQAAHSPHDSESRQKILFASYLLSLVRLQKKGGILEAMVDILHKVSGVSYPLLMNILLPSMLDVVLKGNKECFDAIATHFNSSSFIETIQTLTNPILESVAPQIPHRLYDIIDNDSNRHLVTLSDIEEASRLVFHHGHISIHPSIIDEQDIIRYFEAAFWGYSLPKEWV